MDTGDMDEGIRRVESCNCPHGVQDISGHGHRLIGTRTSMGTRNIEIDPTLPNANTLTILHQVRWKNDGCKEFDRPPLDSAEIEEARVKRRRFLEPIPELPHALGTEDLTEVWERGYKGPYDLENPPQHKTFERYVRELKTVDKRIAMKEKMLETDALQRPAIATPKPKETPPTVPSPPINTPTNGGIPKLAALVNGGAHGLPPKPGSVPLPPRPSTPSAASLPSAPPTPAPTTTTKAKLEEPVKETTAKSKPTDSQLEYFKQVSFSLFKFRGLV